MIKHPKPIFVATHERSCTHLTIDTFRRQFLECRSWKRLGEPLDRLYVSLESILWNDNYTNDLVENILLRCERPLLKYHGFEPDLSDISSKNKYWAKDLAESSDTIYVCRDGRFVLCSFMQYMNKNYNASWNSISEYLRNERMGVSLPKYWANHVKRWLNRDNVNVLKIEDLFKRPEATLTDLALKFNLTFNNRLPLLPPKPLYGWSSAFSRFFSKCPDNTAIIPGLLKPARTPRWQDIFSKEDRIFFHEEAGDVLLQMGYITSERWVDTSSSAGVDS